VKKIEADIRPCDLDGVKRALSSAWITGLSVTEVKGYGPAQAHAEVFRGAGYAVDVVPGIRIEVVVPDPLVPRVVHDLERCLRSGRTGDGRILVDPVDEAVRVRTGERGEGAL
jgi:nitrogen regulatory protein P-II 1